MTWLNVPTTQVYIDSLIAMQPHVSLAALMDAQANRVSLDKFAHVVRFGGENYLEDGHHKAIRAMIEGKRYLIARVLTLP